MDRAKPEITGEIHKVARGENEPGIHMGIHVENGNLILDMGKPIQYLGLTIDDTKMFILGVLAAASLAERDKDEPNNLN